MEKSSDRTGFTLVELLAAIAIIGVLAAILIPSISKVREFSNRSVCASNVRQLCTASSLFSVDNDNELIAAPFNPDGLYWFRQIYPYLKEDERNETTAIFQCPADDDAVNQFNNNGSEWNTISYLFVKSDPDWTSALQIENPADSPQFVDAGSVATNNYRSSTRFQNAVKETSSEWRHGNGINVGYWDGSVIYIEDPTYEKVFNPPTNN